MLSLEYLAGFIDGEGSLSLARIPRGASSYEYCVRVTIANTDRAILQEIQKKWGGTLHSMGRVRNPKWKPGFVLVWTNAAAVTFLRLAAPHLRLKSRHAESLLEFAEHLEECPRRRNELGQLLPHPKEEMELRESYFRQLRGLNRKGLAGSKNQPDEQKHFGMSPEGRISAAYLAGFIDGDGSVMITRTQSRKSGRIDHRARMCVTSTDRGILEQIRGSHGGTVVLNRRGDPGWKRAYQVVWTEGQIEDLLSRVGPHLQLKERQAAILLDFIRHKYETDRRRTGRFLVDHPREVMEFRESKYQQMKGLNARGVALS